MRIAATGSSNEPSGSNTEIRLDFRLDGPGPVRNVSGRCESSSREVGRNLVREGPQGCYSGTRPMRIGSTGSMRISFYTWFLPTVQFFTTQIPYFLRKWKNQALTSLRFVLNLVGEGPQGCYTGTPAIRIGWMGNLVLVLPAWFKKN